MLRGNALARAARACFGEDFPSSQIGTVTVDVRLGDTFWIPKSPEEVPLIDLSDIPLERDLYNTIVVNSGALQLDPGKFIKAITLERFNVPANLVPMFTLRSCMAQAGLEQHTSVLARPNWQGKLVLELINNVNKPLLLRPGLLIGQVSFFELSDWS